MDYIKGKLLFERAEVRWELSIQQNRPKQRTFEINGENIELSGGFKTLHTKVYEDILSGDGLGIEDTRQAIRICEKIRCQ